MELAEEVAAATVRLHEATAREQRQEAELMQERCIWADQQQQSAAEAQAAIVQIAELQGLLKDAHRQLSLAKVSALPMPLRFKSSIATALNRETNKPCKRRRQQSRLPASRLPTHAATRVAQDAHTHTFGCTRIGRAGVKTSG